MKMKARGQRCRGAFNQGFLRRSVCLKAVLRALSMDSFGWCVRRQRTASYQLVQPVYRNPRMLHQSQYANTSHTQTSHCLNVSFAARLGLEWRARTRCALRPAAPAPITMTSERVRIAPNGTAAASLPVSFQRGTVRDRHAFSIGERTSWIWPAAISIVATPSPM